jgi:hypothetical protein
MKMKIVLTMVFMISSIIALNAQKIYELDEVSKIPIIDRENMEVIAFTISDLYKETIKTPEIYSTDSAVKSKVFLYFKIRDKTIIKSKSISGLEFSRNQTPDIENNNRLLFNLIFNENGELFVPDKLFVISYRNDYRGEVTKTNLTSFELKISDSLRTTLQNVKLQRPGLVDKNSLSGDLSPVKVLIPFDLSFRPLTPTEIRNFERTEIDVSIYIKEGNIEFTFGGRLDEPIKQKLIKLIEEHTDLSQYFNGRLYFKIEQRIFNTSIGYNMENDIFVNTESVGVGFNISTFSVKSVMGEVKKKNGKWEKMNL